MARLTPKQARFADEYLVDLNGAQAAIRAGYSPKTAKQTASRLLTNVDLQAVLLKRREELKKSLQVNQERVLEEFARVAFLNLKELFDDQGRLLPIHQIPDDTIRALAGIETEIRTEGRGDEAVAVTIRKIRALDKIRALEGLAKHLGMFVEKHEHSGPGGGPIETKLTDYPPEPKTIAEWVKQREEAETIRKAQEAEGAEG